MPRSDSRFCKVCESLRKVSNQYQPRTSQVQRCNECGQTDYRARGQIKYAGIVMLAPGRDNAMRRLYIREGQVNKPIGYICDTGHVALDEPLEGPHHVSIPVYPPRAVCLDTGEVITADGL